MKKILSFVLACVIGAASVISPVYADEVLVESSSENVLEGYIGMIVDEYGNIKELIPMTYSGSGTYVDRIYTLEPKESYISYQYAPDYCFAVSFGYFTADSYGEEITATTPNPMLRLEILGADSIGGTRHTVKEHDFLTSPEYRYLYKDSYLDQNYNSYIVLQEFGDLAWSYYNGKVTNLSSENADVRILITSY